jgi:hypothetical protein
MDANPPATVRWKVERPTVEKLIQASDWPLNLPLDDS